MVAFQGNLADIALASVLQNLRDAKKTGSLVLRKGDEERWLYLDSGTISMVSRGQGTNAPLVQILLRSTKKKHELRAFAKHKQSKAVHAALLRAKLATKEELASALRANVQEEVYDVFTWEGGTFEFSEGPPADGLFDPAFGEITVSVETQAVTLEAVRRADEWVRIKRLVRGDGDIFVPLRPPDGIEEEWIARIGALIDGRKTVRAVTAEAEMESFHVRTALAWLAEAGYIRRKTVGELVDLAPLLGAGTAAIALKDAVESEAEAGELRTALGDSLARAGKNKEAAVQYKLAASAFAERERLDEATRLLEKAAELSPKDIAVREKLVELARRAGDRGLVEEASLELARLYRRAGLAEKAIEMMEELRSLHEPDEEAELEFAEALLAADRPDEAVNVLRRAGDGFALRGRDRAATAVLERLVRLSPADRPAKEKLHQVRSGMYRRARRMGLRVRFAAYGGCVLFYLVLLGARELIASRELDRAGLDAVRMVSFGVLHDTRRRATQAFAFARERCEDIQRIFGRELLFPPTFASVRAARLAEGFGNLEGRALLLRARRQEALARSATTERERKRLIFLARETYLELSRCGAAPDSLRTEAASKADSLRRELASGLGGGSS